MKENLNDSSRSAKNCRGDAAPAEGARRLQRGRGASRRTGERPTSPQKRAAPDLTKQKPLQTRTSAQQRRLGGWGGHSPVTRM